MLRNQKGARRHGKAGFTLVELLVTIVLIGIISLSTFAIFLSSLNTFGKQKDSMSALQLKNLLVEAVHNEVGKSIKIALTDSFMQGPKIIVKVKDTSQPSGEMEKEVDEISLFPDTNPSLSYLRDNKVTDYNFIYSDQGRVYTVSKNIDGRVNYDGSTNMPTACAPAGGIEVFGNREPFLDDKIYDKYIVDMRFKPIRPSAEEQYFILQVIIDISTKATAEKPSELITRGVETIELNNVRHGKRGILYRNEPTVEWLPEHTAKDGTFKYCYYAKLPAK